MKKLIIAIAIFLTACSTSEIKFTEKTLNLKTPTSVVEIKYPMAMGGNSVAAELINKEVVNCFICDDTPSLDAIITQAKQYEKDSTDYANISKWNGYHNKSLISITIIRNLYMGGAHGSTFINNLCFDANTGEKIVIKDHITDTVKFRELIVSEYVRQNNLDINTPAAEIGYFTELKDLPIPATIELAEKEMVLSYGQYEIACYAVGITYVHIPYEKLNELLKLDVADLKPIQIQEN